jgi:hypothetical protein
MNISQLNQLRPNVSPLDYVHTDRQGRRWRLEVRYRAHDGRAIPVSVTVSGIEVNQEVTQQILRELPFRRLALNSRDQRPTEAKTPNIRARVQMRRERAERAGQGRNYLTPEDVEQTVLAFMEAYTTGRAVVKRVAQQLGIPESTANKRIIKLRKEGLLPVARRSTSGKSTR